MHILIRPMSLGPLDLFLSVKLTTANRSLYVYSNLVNSLYQIYEMNKTYGVYCPYIAFGVCYDLASSFRFLNLSLLQMHFIFLFCLNLPFTVFILFLFQWNTSFKCSNKSFISQSFYIDLLTMKNNLRVDEI